MPIHYFIMTTDEVEILVDTNNIDGLNKYLLDESEDSQELKLYHILSYATDCENLIK